MKIAILGDIHSNSFALGKVLAEISASGIKNLIVTGDMFGYYPWAANTWLLLKPFLQDSYFVLGNHDMLLLNEPVSDSLLSYYSAAVQNRDELLKSQPDSIRWLESLTPEKKFNIEKYKIHLVHGSPSDPVEGRYYPDTPGEPESVNTSEILIMGHTHYPVIRTSNSAGWIINPGSVGQPRDGNPMPSWICWDTDENSFQLRRTNYDNISVMQLLTTMKWDERSVRALNKTSPGSLQ